MSQTALKKSPCGAGQESVAFGHQLLLDLYNCEPGACDDLTLNYRFLDEMVEALGMEKQSPPSLFRSDAVRFPEKAGLSGWIPLIESSIVIHTLSVKNFISVDIYCCREFDAVFAEKFCRDYFKPQRLDAQYLRRGKDYYKS
ncbi:MAG TPA: S-adenosylmethionine decarboxylase [Candidatus Omnitrophota bacterium]|nr:S-adenosylmethionine decarboxylase [Candidatus Omnitrophota bacterium]